MSVRRFLVWFSQCSALECVMMGATAGFAVATIQVLYDQHQASKRRQQRIDNKKQESRLCDSNYEDFVGAPRDISYEDIASRKKQ